MSMGGVGGVGGVGGAGGVGDGGVNVARQRAFVCDYSSPATRSAPWMRMHAPHRGPHTDLAASDREEACAAYGARGAGRIRGG